MPPIIPRKRLKSESPSSEPAPKRSNHHAHPRRSKDSIFATLDAPPTTTRTLSQTKKFLEQGDDDSKFSETGSSEDEFEDVPLDTTVQNGLETLEDDSTYSEDEQWEDALGEKHHALLKDEPIPVISGDIEFTVDTTPLIANSLKPDGKKGPSKIERQIRNVTHCIHVQYLMFHNLIRNAWISDTQVQKILVRNLTIGCWKEVNQYWRNAGISNGHARVVEGGWTRSIADELESSGSWKASGREGIQFYESPKSNAKTKTAKSKSARKSETSATNSEKLQPGNRNQRDWGAASNLLEPNTPNLSAGDPLVRLMKYLSAYWRAKFKITTPCLRKRGYLSPSSLEAEIQAWKEHNSDTEIFGERIEDLQAFRVLAHRCEGSRDVGQQLFTALLRGLGIEARMVASLQPAGFGWSKAEEGKPKDLNSLKNRVETRKPNGIGTLTPNKDQAIGSKTAPIDVSDSESSDLSSAISLSSDAEVNYKNSKKSRKTRKYGDELPHPTYWTEAISNLTHTPIAVSPLPRTIISTSPEQLLNYYCRGVAADKAKQVFAYVIAFSLDGSAKDVTTRYLPKHQWPGRTKGFRMPAEKIPIYNKQGKVKQWEEWDWFKSVMRSYARPIQMRQPWDEVEDEGDLVPAKPMKPKHMNEEGGKETLQGYKNSTEYVLERHLRREEAIKPGAKIVRHFTTGKGENEKQEPVFRRKDVVPCKSVESWHKEGREVKEGEQPLKFVPRRAVTVQRKREIEEREREEGEKVKQGLYSQAQTDWIIPDPIVDGKIPRNAFGNIDVYVPTMIPLGAVHIPLRGTAKVCRKLKIDYAEACTGFEFGKQRAVPVLTGVVVAAENEDLVIDAWEAGEAEKAQKESEKREKMVLSLWKKFTLGLRIVQRMKREFGEDMEVPKEQMKNSTSLKRKDEWETFQQHADFEGGFLRDASTGARGFIQDDNQDSSKDEGVAGSFMTASQEDVKGSGGTLIIDHGEAQGLVARQPALDTYQTPVSLHAFHQKPSIGDDHTNSPLTSDHPKCDTDTGVPSALSGRHTCGSTESVGGSSALASSHESFFDDNESDDETRLSQNSSGPTPKPTFSDSTSAFVSAREELTLRQHETQKRSVLPPDRISTRKMPMRKAAIKSEARVRSHFFAHDTDEETDMTDPNS